MILFHRRGLLGLWVLLSASILVHVVEAQAQEPESSDPLAPVQSDAVTPTDDSASSHLPASPPGGGVVGPNYVLGPEDVVSIDVFNVPELKQTVRVENDGMISVKLLGRVKAAGLTTGELKKELETGWGESYLQSPEVTVFVREFHAQPVSVIGAVEKPGLYNLPGPRTLLEVLSLAGGLSKAADGPGKYLYVTRKKGFGTIDPVPGLHQVSPDQVQVALKPLLYSHEEALNIPIKPFDIVSVSKADVVYVVGAVMKPGGFTLGDRNGVSVLQAVALAGGLGPGPAKKATRIIHRAGDGTLTETHIDIGKIMEGKASDLELAANDVLFVPTSASKYVSYRGAESVIGMLTGIAMYRGF